MKTCHEMSSPSDILCMLASGTNKLVSKITFLVNFGASHRYGSVNTFKVAVVDATKLLIFAKIGQNNRRNDHTFFSVQSP